MKYISILAIMSMFAVTGWADQGSAAAADSASNSANSANNDVSNDGVTINFNDAPADRGRAGDPEVVRQEVVHGGDYDVRNVPNVSAPGLTTTLTETCMGSSSVGGAGVGFGISFGTTWRDTSCVRRLDARQVQSLGYPEVAKELMCDSKAVRAAFARAGKPCVEDR